VNREPEATSGALREIVAVSLEEIAAVEARNQPAKKPDQSDP
jgi:hypothetical protein